MSENPSIWDPSISLLEIDEDIVKKSENTVNLQLLNIVRSFGSKNKSHTIALIDNFVRKLEYDCLFDSNSITIKYIKYIENISKNLDPRINLQFLNNMRDLSFYLSSVKDEYLSILNNRQYYHLYADQLEFFTSQFGVKCELGRQNACVREMQNIITLNKRDDAEIAKDIVCTLRLVHNSSFVEVFVC